MDDKGLELLIVNNCKCTSLLKVLVVFGICIGLQCKTEAQTGNWFGKKGVFLFHEQTQMFRSTCLCYLLEHGSSYNYMKFRLEKDGRDYDLCREGYYVTDITQDRALCKPCPNGTYSPFKNACPYCLLCRKCGSNELEETACSRVADRTCICTPGKTCHIDNPSASNEPIGEQYSTRFPYSINGSNEPTTSSTRLPYSIVNDSKGPTSTLPCHTDLCSPENDQEKDHLLWIIIVIGILFFASLICNAVLIFSLKKAHRKQREKEQYCIISTAMIHGDGPTFEMNSEHIEHLVKKIGPCDYKTIGSHLTFELTELENIEKNNQNDIKNATRSMLNIALQRHYNFIEAFEKSERFDLVGYLKNNCVRQSRNSRSANASDQHNAIAMDQPSTSTQ